ncbi:MAG: hypothetical protein HC869_16890 [Rhodospirillales bacterium]|nr:hypothetical protein [Rhodospirillales bacterium]
MRRASTPGAGALDAQPTRLLHYDLAWLSKDVAASPSVAVIALPAGIAYAHLMGLPAAIGTCSAIVQRRPTRCVESSEACCTRRNAA